MTHFLYDESAKFAVEAVAKPLLDSFVALKLTGGRDAIHIVMIDPDSPRLEPRILFESTIGVVPEGKEYVAIAREKACQSWINRCDTREHVRLNPHLLRDGNVLFAGGVFRHDLAVGVSGLPSAWDEVIATAAAESCRALCFETSEDNIAFDDGPLFLPTSATAAA